MTPAKDATVIVYQAPWDWEFLWNRAQPLATSLSRHAEVIYLNGGVIGTTGVAAGLGRIVSRLPAEWRWHRQRLTQVSPSLSIWTWQELQPDPMRLIREDRPARQYRRLRRYLQQRAAEGASIWLLDSRPLTDRLRGLFPWDRFIVDIEDPWFDLNWAHNLDTGAALSFIRDADCVFANGPSIAAEYETRSGRRVVSLPNGVDAAFVEQLAQDLTVPEFYGAGDNSLKAVFTGNINDRIDFEGLAEIVQEPGWRFFFVGQDSVPDRQRAAWNRILASANVCVVPPRPHRDIPAILQHADALLMPYSRTGHEKMFPAKLFEYAAAGKPIITTLDYTAGKFVIPSAVICGSIPEFRQALRGIRDHGGRIPADIQLACAAMARQNTWDARAAAFMAIVSGQGGDCGQKAAGYAAHQTEGSEAAACKSTT